MISDQTCSGVCIEDLIALTLVSLLQWRKLRYCIPTSSMAQGRENDGRRILGVHCFRLGHVLVVVHDLDRNSACRRAERYPNAA